MLTLSQQVTSLELSKRLDELGVKQESLFYWINLDNDTFIWAPGTEIIMGADNCEIYDEIEFKHSAFTASELLDLLPSHINTWLTTNINTWGLAIDANSIVTSEGIEKLFSVTYAAYDKKLFNEYSDLNICNALATTIIHLIENKLLEINK
jgi:hypothetical protein